MAISPSPAVDKLKIGLVFDDSLDKPDGVQQYILSIGQWLTVRGHDVHYLVGETKRQDLANVHSLSRNVTVKFNGNRMSIPLPTSATKLKKFLDDQQFDVLHVQLPYSPYLAHRIIIAASHDVAVIGTFHIYAENKLVAVATKLLSYWLQRSLQRFDVVVSVSEPAKQFSKQFFGIETTILPNVIDYQRFAIATPLQEYSDDVLNVLFLGRLVPRKGCQLLLEAINLIKNDDLPKFRVIICGKGHLLENLKAYVAQNQLDQLVEFVGFVSEADKPSYYASANIAVFPSNGGESFGIVLVEAMASGQAAVLAGDNSGYHSVMYEDQDLLFDPHDATVLAEKLTKYLRNESLRLATQAWGQNYAKTFDTALIGAKILDICVNAERSR